VAFSRDGRVMYISGTHSNPLNPQSDYMTDLQLAVGTLTSTSRYRQAETIYLLHGPERVVGHSLGASIAKEIVRRYHPSTGVRGTYYNAPFTPFTRFGAHEQSFAHRLDPVGILDTGSQRSFYFGSPHSYHGHV
jgi:alpha-beta hydrolase superfamily lysophospholipase